MSEKAETKTAPRRLKKPPELRGRDKKATLNSKGQEMVSNERLEAALKFVAEPSVSERIRQAIKSEALRREAEAAGMESFEDADDFDIGDDYDPSSPYEEIFEGSVVDDVMRRGQEIAEQRKKEQEQRKADGTDETLETVVEQLQALKKDELMSILSHLRDKKQKGAEGER